MAVLPPEVIAIPEQHGETGQLVWLLMNVMTRTSLGLDGAAMQELGRLAQGRSGEGTFQVWETFRFSNEDGLLADPTRIKRPASAWGQPAHLSSAELAERLRRQYLLIESEEAYREVLGRKKSIFDKAHIGNLHDQLSAFLVLGLKENPAEWWIRQKFTGSPLDVRRDNLYGVVQQPFLAAHFARRLGQGMHAVDLGCGVGYYTKLMGAGGAEVLGIDPDESYIRIAQQESPANVRFACRDVGTAGALDLIGSGTLDYAFMSDALQFYFVPYRTPSPHRLDRLIADLERVLKPGGTFAFMEPHPVFYQAPWLGDETHPFTVKTEYRNRVQGIIPTLREYMQAFLEAGFVLTWFDEVYAQPGAGGGAVRDRAFASEFPMWAFYEFKRRQDDR